MTEEQIASFWQSHPCGENTAGSPLGNDYDEFFQSYDRRRYAREGHILACLDQIDFHGKRVLEIGLGQGADSEQIIRRGAIWSGIDLTAESVKRVRARLNLRRLPYESIECGSALSLPFADKTFDMVFSHGALHHVPNIERAQNEIHRVLRPNGELIIMVYAKWSLNYLLSIGLVRRMALVPLFCLDWAPSPLVRSHIENAKKMGLWRYLRLRNFIHFNTDGPENPFSRVYELRLMRRHFPRFDLIKSYKRYMHAPPLPVHWIPLEAVLGWHLWVHLRPKKSGH
jgi:SAM-dependent methyltransferase